MQVTAPDFYAPNGERPSAQREDRSASGQFDSLLREEESRYEREAPPARERPETAHSTHDDYERDEPVPTADGRDPARDAAQAPDERQADRSGRDPATASKEDSTAGDSATAAGEGETAAPVPASDAADDGTVTAAAAGGPAEGNAAAAQQANAAAAVIPGQVSKNATAVAATGGQAATATAQAAPAAPTAGSAPATTESGPATTETAALPASAAAPAAKAAGKASETATSKDSNPVAAAHRQSPTTPPVAPAEHGNRPSTGTGTVGNSPNTDPVTSVQTTEGLNSRPSAALGGGSATAALAQNAGGASETSGNSRGQPDGDAAAPDASPLATGAKKSNAPPSQASKGLETATAASDKMIPAAQANSAATGDGAGTGGNTGQPASTPQLTVGTAMTGNAVQNSSFADSLASARQTPAADPAEQVAIQVRRAQVAGQEQVNIKLHPAELGRIEVKLESNNDGTLRAVISAERSETLDLLQRDARGLERALQEAGVKTDSGSLNFSLRGQGQNQGQQAGGERAPAGGSFDDSAGPADGGEASLSAPPQPGSHHDGALDIRV